MKKMDDDECLEVWRQKQEEVKTVPVEEARRILAERGIAPLWLQYANDKEVTTELARQYFNDIVQGQMNVPMKRVGLPDGHSITPDGTTYIIYDSALMSAFGYTYEEVAALESPYEEWCKLTHTPLDPEYIKKKERKLKRKAKQDEKNKIVRFAIKKFNS